MFNISVIIIVVNKLCLNINVYKYKFSNFNPHYYSLKVLILYFVQRAQGWLAEVRTL